MPASIPPESIRHVGALFDSLFVASRRIRTPERLQARALDLRNAAFDSKVAGRLLPGTSAVVTVQEAARETLQSALRLGIRSYLFYVIAHHAFCRSLLQEEATLQPDYAATLQCHQFPSYLWRRLESEVKLADYVFCLSSFQMATFLEAGVPREKLVLTPLGVDLELFRPRPKRDDGKFRVLFKGQITQRKGLSYLIDGFRKAAIPNSELILAGRVVGTDRPWRGVPGIIHVPHFPLKHQMTDLYAKADVFAVPSLVDGFLLTALEAMASGLPVIVSRNTFGSDIISDGDDGFLIPIRDSDAVADRLRMLYENPGMRELVGRRARKAAERFSWEQYGALILEVISSRKASSRVGVS